MTMEELEELIDFGWLFIGMWSAVEYGTDREQYKQTILDAINAQLALEKDV